jgi:predicted 3-demethylubiquinone-9 3-methyltransferase (glyoxalase superfamily)
MACGSLTDKFGLCWQIVPEKMGEILKHPERWLPL